MKKLQLASEPVRFIQQNGLAVALGLMSLWAPGRGAAQSTEVWVHCATEGEFCYFSGSAKVRMGSGTRYNTLTRTASNGGVQCSINIFGDAYPKVLKSCDILKKVTYPLTKDSTPSSAPPATWVKVAAEGAKFSVTSTQTVRYGVRTSWVQRTVSGSAVCDNAFFGIDPVAGIAKACWVDPAASSGPGSGTGGGTGGGSPGTGGGIGGGETPSGDYHPSGYNLIFGDEFTGTQLDRSLWCTRFMYGGGPAPQVQDSQCGSNGDGTLDFLNDEQQRYVDKNRAGETMHVVNNGVLSLRATKTRTNDSWASYEAAMIRSKQTFVPTASRSIYMTARVKLPNVRGTWPAFWLVGVRGSDGAINWPPEIDILEAPLNERDDTANMLRQGSQVRDGRQTGSGDQEITYAAPEFDRTWDNYHSTSSLRGVWLEIGLEWTAQSACYFVNGYKTMCENYRWVRNDGGATGPAAVILNLAVGGSWAGRYGINDSLFPTTVEVDHVRVYSK